MSVELPILDISQPLDPSSLSSLAQASNDWGFFLIKNHGISKDMYEKLCVLSNQVFTTSLDTKLKLGTTTYTPQFIASPYFETIRISGPDYFSSAKASADILFKPPNTDFCSILQEYGSKMMELSKKITLFLLKSLDDRLETKYYQAEFSKCHGYLRINNYSIQENRDPKEVEGLGMHTDMSCITILYQDEMGGLQVKSRDGEWMDVVSSKSTLIVNIGDMMQAWSNGRLRSSAHRVVLRKQKRLSFAFFWCFEDDKVISAPDELVEKQRIYRPFICLDYVKFREINSKQQRFDKVGHTVDDFARIKDSETPDEVSV